MSLTRRDPFEDIFGDFFKGSGLYRQESWNHSGTSMYVDLELAGVDAATITVSHIGRRVIARWTDRMGASQRRYWDIQDRFSGVSARFRNGLLTVTVELQPPAPEPKEVPVKVELG